LNASAIISAPMAKTNALIIKITANAPGPGKANSNNPNAIEKMAISANSHLWREIITTDGKQKMAGTDRLNG
jgi:hypothetical protein